MDLVITRQQLEEWAGRHLTEREIERLQAALPHSSVPDAIGTILAGLEE